MLILATLSITVFILIFIGFSLKKQYRYATMIFDMLPAYPVLIVTTFIISSIILFFGLNIMYASAIIPSFGIVSLIFFYSSVEWARDYNLRNYKRFLVSLQSERFEIREIEDYITDNLNPNKVNIFIRHDVDISLKRTLKMADIERSFGLPSTYLFRRYAERYSFEKAIPIIQKMAEWGFDIGLHYETLSQTQGNKSKAIQLLEENIIDMRKLVPVKVVAAHGQRDYKNRDIWDEVDKDRLQIKSFYDMNPDLYISDAGGKRLRNKDEKILFGRVYEAKPGSVVQILIHPDWWF